MNNGSIKIEDEEARPRWKGCSLLILDGSGNGGAVAATGGDGGLSYMHFSTIDPTQQSLRSLLFIVFAGMPKIALVSLAGSLWLHLRE